MGRTPEQSEQIRLVAPPVGSGFNPNSGDFYCRTHDGSYTRYLPEDTVVKTGWGTGALITSLALGLAAGGFIGNRLGSQGDLAAVPAAQDTQPTAAASSTPARTSTPGKSPSPSLVAPSPTSTKVPDPEACVAEWTIEERLGQMIMIPVDGKGSYALHKSSPEETLKTIRKFNIGGVNVINGEDVVAAKLKALTPTIADTSVIPPIVATDLEGGDIIHVKDSVTAKMPSQEDASKTMDPLEAQTMANKQYTHLAKTYGINTVFGPVLDKSRPDGKDSAITQSRIFTGDASAIASFVKAYVRAASDAGMLTVGKHFPGGGSMTIDTSTGKATIPSLDALKKNGDLNVWESAKGTLQNAMVTSASILPNDSKKPATSWSDNSPAIFSPQVVSSLKKDYGINGIIFSDDLGAPSIALPLPDAFVKAWDAGVTMPLFVQKGSRNAAVPVLEEQLAQIISAGKAAVKAGTLDEKMITAAVVTNLSARDALNRACTLK